MSSGLVGSMMESPVATVAANATLRSAARALREGEVGTLVIMGGDDIVGIVSERDVVRALADDADPDDVWVADVMSASPRYLTKGESVTSAVEIMLTAGIRHLPVVDEGELVGIVSMRDLARRLLD